MDATATNVPTAEGTPALPARAVSAITTDRALGMVVLGALGFLVLIRRTFRGTVV